MGGGVYLTNDYRPVSAKIQYKLRQNKRYQRVAELTQKSTVLFHGLLFLMQKGYEIHADYKMNIL